jgi:hypothetical protein
VAGAGVPSTGCTEIATARAGFTERTGAGANDIPVPPSSAEAGLELVGARRCLYAEGHMPHLLYLVGRQDVSLFVLEGEARPEATLASLGHRSNVWSVGANTFVLVALAGEGGLDADDLSRVEGYVRAQLE